MNTPQPILPGVPVLTAADAQTAKKILNIVSTAIQEDSLDVEALNELLADSALCEAIALEVNAHAATADPATFPKAEPPVPESHAMGLVASADQLHLAISVFLKDWRDGDFQLSELAAIHALAIEKKYLEVGRALKAGNDAFLEFQAMLSSPSAGTEQKERGGLDYAWHKVEDSLPEISVIVWVSAGGGTALLARYDDYRWKSATSSKSLPFAPRFWQHFHLPDFPDAPAAPTDGTTTPRTDAVADGGKVMQMSHRYAAMFGHARTLERELALTEKRLGEAQGERDALRKDLIAISDGCSVGLPDRVEAIKRIIGIRVERDDLRTQLATSQARLVELQTNDEANRKSLMAQVVELQSLRSALAQAKRENEKLITGLHELSSRSETDAMEIGTLMAENASLRAQLRAALRPHGGQEKLSP